MAYTDEITATEKIRSQYPDLGTYHLAHTIKERDFSDYDTRQLAERCRSAPFYTTLARIRRYDKKIGTAKKKGV